MFSSIMEAKKANYFNRNLFKSYFKSIISLKFNFQNSLNRISLIIFEFYLQLYPPLI